MKLIGLENLKDIIYEFKKIFLGVNSPAISAKKLTTPVNINGVSFDGTKDINVSVDNTKTVNGFTVNSNVPSNAVFTDTKYSNGTGLSLIGTSFSVNYGTTSSTACRGDDVRLSNARPANGGTSASCSGNSATATKLQNARTISITGGVTGSANFDGSSNLTINTSLAKNISVDTVTCTGEITAFSDKRLKENIEVIKNPLDRISLINGYIYNFKDTPDIQRTGLIAQELQKVLPQAVKKVPHKEYGEVLTVAYGETVGLLFEGMKELISENKKLKKEIDELKLKIK